MNTIPPIREPFGRARHPAAALEPIDPIDLGFDDERDSFDLRKVLHTLWRGKWIMLAAVVVGLGLVALYLWHATPLYTAEAQVRFRTREEQITDLQSVVGGISPEGATLNTETMVLTSRSVIAPVVDKLHLADDPEFAPVADEADSGETDQSAESRREAAIDALDRKLTITVLPNSYVLSIKVVTQDPQKSAAIANAVADAYISHQLETKFDATRRATEWLSGQVADLKDALAKAEGAVEDFAAASPAVSDEAQKLMAARLKSLRDSLRDRFSRRQALEARLSDVKTLRAVDDFHGIATQLDDPALVQLSNQIAGAGDGNAREALVSAFDAKLGDRADGLQKKVAVLRAQIATLRQAVAEAENRLEANGEELVRFRQLQREAEATRLIYQHFLSRMKETSAQEGVQQADSEFLQPATPPEIRSSPDRQGLILRAAVLSIALGAGLVLMLERLNRRFRTPEELEEAIAAPVISVIPTAPGRSPMSYVIDRPESAVAESIRSLRTSLLLSNLDRPSQVVMMTSSVSGEGKSVTLMMLAQVTAQMGKRTLVIESDIRRPTFRKILMGENGAEETKRGQRSPGLLSVLSGQMSIKDAVYQDAESGMDLIFSQKSKANAADIFSSDRFTEFVSEARTHYDSIFLDAPPVLLVPDARIIGQAADAVVYAVRWNSTTRDQVSSGLKLLGHAQLQIAGLAMTRVDARAMAKYGYYGYGASYGAGSEYYVN